MRVNGGRNFRLLLAAGIVTGTLGVAGLAPAAVAGATTSVTLYVRSHATGSTCTAPAPTMACGSVRHAVTVARGRSGTVTITVGFGTYLTSDVTLSTGGESSLTIKGAGATTTTYIYADYTGRVFLLETGDVPVTIEGAVVAEGSDCPGGGVDAYPGHTLVLRDDTFESDHACFAGAVRVSSGSHATFSHDTFVDDNASTGTGGAVVVSTGASATFTSDTFVEDYAEYGGAVYVDTGASASFTTDVFTTDYAGECGAGVYLTTYVRASFATDTFTYDYATGCGGAIALFYRSSATVSGTDFSHDWASGGGAIIVSRGATGTVSTSAVGASCYVSTGGTLSGTNDVLSGTALPSCLTYLHIPVSASCPAGTTSCGSSQARPGKSVTVESRGASATYTGHGSVSIGSFRSDPVGAFGGSGATFFGVSISTGTGAKSLVITIPSADAGNALEWWNGSTWQPVDAIASCGTTTCAEFIFSATSTPSLATIVKLSRTSRFGAVIFAVR